MLHTHLGEGRMQRPADQCMRRRSMLSMLNIESRREIRLEHRGQQRQHYGVLDRRLKLKVKQLPRRVAQLIQQLDSTAGRLVVWKYSTAKGC